MNIIIDQKYLKIYEDMQKYMMIAKEGEITVK